MASSAVARRVLPGGAAGGGGRDVLPAIQDRLLDPDPSSSSTSLLPNPLPASPSLGQAAATTASSRRAIAPPASVEIEREAEGMPHGCRKQTSPWRISLWRVLCSSSPSTSAPSRRSTRRCQVGQRDDAPAATAKMDGYIKARMMSEYKVEMVNGMMQCLFICFLSHK